MSTRHRYFIINKPYGMLSQFVSEKDGVLLGSLNFNFPEGIHAVGRLDKQSEGLLILTTNKKVTRLLFQSEMQHKRTYLVKVKNMVSKERLQQLETGINIRIKGGVHYKTSLCEVSIAPEPTGLFQAIDLPVSYPPYTWLLMSLTEGKFHQIRKMVAAIHHRCQRLVRMSIEELSLGNLQPGQVKEIEESEFFRMLKIDTCQKSIG